MRAATGTGLPFKYLNTKKGSNRRGGEGLGGFASQLRQLSKPSPQRHPRSRCHVRAVS